MKTNPLVNIVQPGIIADQKSYWAMHFCSILETLHQQKQLKYSFRRSIPDEAPQSLANLVANTPPSFFGQLKGSITNFGLQYFLAHYLMSYEGRNAVVSVLNGIANAYDVDLAGSLSSFGVSVCGVDSYSGHQFLQSTDAVIFGYNEHTIQNVWRDINYVDLCILLERKIFPYKVAVLGEVEGNNGAKLLRDSFWDQKSSFCSFGIGVVTNDSGHMTIQTFQTLSGLKTILTLSSSFSVVEDFKTAIDTLDVLFSMRPHIKIPLHDGMEDVVNLIRHHWNYSVEGLIKDLKSMIVSLDSTEVGVELIAMPSVPKIVLPGDAG